MTVGSCWRCGQRRYLRLIHHIGWLCHDCTPPLDQPTRTP